MMRIEPMSRSSLRLFAMRIAVVVTDAYLFLFAIFVLLMAWPYAFDRGLFGVYRLV